MGLSFSTPDSSRGPIVAIAFRRTALAIIPAATLTALATVGALLTTAPRWVSLMFEPFSLLLIPGYLLEAIIAGPYRFDDTHCLPYTFFLLLLFFSILFRVRTHALRPSR